MRSPPSCAAAIRPISTASDLNRPSLDATRHRPHRRDARQRALTSRAAISSAPTIRAARTSRPVSPRLPIFTTLGGHRRPHATLQPRRGDGQGHRRPHRSIRTRRSPTATTESNDDRNFNRYGADLRTSYELTPGVKPFVESGADTREHDRRSTASAYTAIPPAVTPEPARHSNSRACSPARSRSAGLQRNYVDPTLQNLSGHVSTPR